IARTTHLPASGRAMCGDGHGAHLRRDPRESHQRRGEATGECDRAAGQRPSPRNQAQAPAAVGGHRARREDLRRLRFAGAFPPDAIRCHRRPLSKRERLGSSLRPQLCNACRARTHLRREQRRRFRSQPRGARNRLGALREGGAGQGDGDRGSVPSRRGRGGAPTSRADFLPTAHRLGASANRLLRPRRSVWYGGGREMLSTVEKVLFLKAIELFSQITGEDLAPVALIAAEETRESGEVIFAEGEAGDALYLVLDGRVRIDREEEVIAELGER